MKWLEEMEKHLGVCGEVILYGNVYDRFSYTHNEKQRYFEINTLLRHFLEAKGYKIIGYYDMVDSLIFPAEEMKKIFEAMQSSVQKQAPTYQTSGSPQAVQAKQGPIKISYPTPAEALLAIRKAMTNENVPCAIIINFSDCLVSCANESDEGKRLRIILQKIASEATRTGTDASRMRNSCILIADELGKLPSDLYIKNPHVKHFAVGKPDKSDRESFISSFAGYFYMAEGVTDEVKSMFTDLTDGLATMDLFNLAQLSEKKKIPLREVKKLVNTYKFGEKEDYWAKLNMNKIGKAAEIIRERVIGQDQAVEVVVDMIVRGKMGMSGLQHSSSSAKPKGVLLFVGRTGVGKTELAKATAEFLFGDENACIRFDMSEYNHEHCDQRLVGAPPGYVGFEEGGQLTNRVRERPFSVLLFDEIEKAHPRIFDKFLQILEDGRLTDGKGETVYFSETVIIFTSNIGSDSLPDSISEEELQRHFKEAVNNKFRKEWGRPELLNRIGENIVVFNPINSYDFKKKIVEKSLRQISFCLGKAHGITIRWTDELCDYVIHHRDGFGKNGARGAGNILEKYVINKISKYIFLNAGKLACDKVLAVTVVNNEVEISG